MFEMCAFCLFLHELVQLGANFCGQLVLLMDEIIHKLTRNLHCPYS